MPTTLGCEHLAKACASRARRAVRLSGFLLPPERCRSSFIFSSRRRHTRWPRDWSSDVCSSDLPRRRRDRRLPRPGPARRLRQRAPCPPPGQLSDRAGPGRRHRRGYDAPPARARLDAGARRPAPDRRRDRREPAQAERRVRSRLSFVGGGAGPCHGSDPREPRVDRLLPAIAEREGPIRVHGVRESAEQPGGGHAGDVLGRHRLPPPGLAGRRRGLRGRRAAAAPPPRHARGRRRHAEAPATRAAHQRRPRRDDRLDRLSLPWELLAMVFLLAILGATAAAWWPARTVARLPVMLALSGRPPKPRPARHAAIAAAALILVGIASLALSSRDRPPFIVAGILSTILGCLLLGPPAIRIFAGLAGRLSIAPRLALRDLVRYQARSGAALAAVSLALGIAATVVVIASAEAAKRSAEPPNLSDRQVRVYLGRPKTREVIPAQAVRQVDRLSASVRQLAAQLGDADVLPLRKVFQPGTPAFFDPVAGYRVLPTTELTRKSGQMYRTAAELFVATPAVLRYLGIDPATIDPGTDFLAAPGVPTNELVIPSFRY